MIELTRRARALFLPLLLAGVAACAVPASKVQTEAFRADVEWLADDARQGRDTGTPELYETAEYVAAAFAAAGLQPLGDDGGWHQEFTVRGRRRLVEGNALTVAGQSFELHREWRPLQSATTGSVEGELVFAGYGLVDPDGGRDDYAGLDVAGRVVVVLRRGPDSAREGSRYAEGGPGRERISFASKINTAFQRGAAALLVVNDPQTYEPGSRRDRPQAYTNIGAVGAGGVAASLPAASLTAAAGQRLLDGFELKLAELQAAADAESGAPARTLGGTAQLTLASERPEVVTVNTLGFLPGKGALADEHVLIGAHMDHVGLGLNATSRGGQAAVGQIHNGADDNASGTAGVLAAARRLAALDDGPRRGVIFATWSGEEWGLLGSRHYVEHPALPLERMAATVNMDMIGRSQEGYVAIEGLGSAEGLRDLVLGAHGELRLGLVPALADKASGNSDHAPFFDKGVPVVSFFTGLHDDYHMPGDTVDKVNMEGGAQIALLASEVVRRITRQTERPVFASLPVAATPDPHAAGPAADAAAPAVPVLSAYRVVLGTSPDMGYQGDDGVRISSVRAGTPAEAAGLLAGDLIVAFDGRPVTNLEDYSVLLFSRKPGDRVTITVKRDGQTLELQATLGGQSGEA